MKKGDPSNPKVGDSFYYIPVGALFIIPITIEEVYTQDGWDIECYWIDEPVGHALYEAWEWYKTLAGAKSGLRAKKREIKKLLPDNIINDKVHGYSLTLDIWRNPKIEFFRKQHEIYKQEGEEEFSLQYKEKPFYT